MRWAVLAVGLNSVVVLAQDKPSPEVEKLIKALKSTSSDAQLNALKKLGQLGEKAKPAMKPIVDLYINTKSSPVQKQALEAIGAIHAESKSLILEFQKENDEARLDALTKLHEFAADDIKPLAAVVIQTANRERQRTAGESLAMDYYFETIAKHYANDPGAATLFVEAITLGPGPRRGYAARRAAVEHVASIPIDKKQLHRALASALAERDPEIREKCCQRLSELGAVAKPSLSILRAMSKNDPDDDVRQAAAAAVKFIETAK